MTLPAVAPARLRIVRDDPVHEDRDYVLYWMIAQRRTRWNHALQHAVRHAQRLHKPLVILEPLDVDYRWASERFHAFVIRGMRDNQARCEAAGVAYHPWVGREPGDGQGLLQTLADRACLVVADDHPAFRWPTLLLRASQALDDVRLEAVEGVSVLPLNAADKTYKRAVDYRRFVHKHIGEHLDDLPVAEPLDADLPGPAELPARVGRAWPAADPAALLAPDGLAGLPIDHDITEVEDKPGGPEAGEARLDAFLRHRLSEYTDRNHPDADAASGLSPWLHFGHVSAAEAFHQIVTHEGWSPEDMDRDRFAKQEGAWGMSAGAEGFLEELLTWRELGHSVAWRQPVKHATYDGLPGWARETLEEHADDPREHDYSVEELARAETSDPIWNAAQRELRATGVVQNYLRMLWGKRVLAWRPTPRDAFDTLVELNNRYALDGRDANSYSGIAWVFGRYDRAWGPERPIYGKVRYMTSDSTRRKLRLSDYLERWGDG
jgi:deoxyribodipyrimidine photo-lyase